MIDVDAWHARHTMWQLAVVVVMVATGSVQAAPAPTWADWVGDYTGPLRWKGCSAPGAKTATLAVDAVDGVMTIELAPAGGGLAKLSLVEDDGGWSAQQGDTVVHVTRPREQTIVDSASGSVLIDLVVELESGCTLRATLVRPSSIASCTRLAAWARIEASCTRPPTARLEDGVALGRDQLRWSAARGADRARLGAVCEGRASTLELALVERGCAPDPNIALVRASQCHALGQLAARLERCDRIPPHARGQIAALATQLVGAAHHVDRASAVALDAQCQAATAKLRELGASSGCL